MTIPIPAVAAETKATCSSGPRVLRWLSLGMFLLGGILLGRAWWTNDLSGRSAEWPTTEGTVLDARVVREGSKGESKFRAVVRYSYAVSGQQYESERVSLASSKTKQSRDEKTVSEYPSGSAVTVHYDPEQPGDALLVIGPSHETVPLAAVGGVLLLMSGFLFTRGLQTGARL